MAFISDQSINTGLYVPTTNVWETQVLQQTDVNSQEFKRLLVRLYENINRITIALNQKDSALYDLTEFVDGQLFFPLVGNSINDRRSNFRKVFNIGALGPGVTSIAHGLTITTPWSFTRIYGVANNTTTGNYYPLPWVSAAGATNIELRLDNTNIVITNNSGVAFTVTYVIVEYLKN